MKRAAIIVALFVAGAANAAGFAPLALQDTGETCYSWNGGNFSAGSFSKCQPVVVLAQAAPAPPPPAPVLMNNVCPPQIILEPEPQRKRTPIKRKPRPKLTC